ncbi:unnamed protein product [Amoebophrya sp. A120]|nr:unnamed protein product [Amoebophrya sp. A120]|eukprot:GSA120T00005924001.1
MTFFTRLLGRFLPTWLLGMNGKTVTNLDRFLSYLGLVYFWAFAGYYLQVRALYGLNGLMPVADMKKAGGGAQSPYAPLPYLSSALYAIFGAGTSTSSTSTDHTVLEAVSLLGMVLSLLLWLFPRTWLLRCGTTFACWQCYLALYSVGQTFLSFQWDILLLEVGFLANLYNLSSSVYFHNCVDWLLRALFVKLMFMTGVVKQSSNCQTWKDLTALEYHYVSQCLPTEMAWFAHQVHPFVNRLGVAFMFSIQLAPGILLIYVPYLRDYVAMLHAVLQIGIFLTGNYNWFNVLSAILLWPCLGSGSTASSGSDLTGDASSGIASLTSYGGGSKSSGSTGVGRDKGAIEMTTNYKSTSKSKAGAGAEKSKAAMKASRLATPTKSSSRKIDLLDEAALDLDTGSSISGNEVQKNATTPANKSKDIKNSSAMSSHLKLKKSSSLSCFQKTRKQVFLLFACQLPLLVLISLFLILQGTDFGVTEDLSDFVAAKMVQLPGEGKIQQLLPTSFGAGVALVQSLFSAETLAVVLARFELMKDAVLSSAAVVFSGEYEEHPGTYLFAFGRALEGLDFWKIFHGDFFTIKSTITDGGVRQYLHWYTQYGLVAVQIAFFISALRYLFAVTADHDVTCFDLWSGKGHSARKKSKEPPSLAIEDGTPHSSAVGMLTTSNSSYKSHFSTAPDGSPSSTWTSMQRQNQGGAASPPTILSKTKRIFLFLPIALVRLAAAFVALNLGMIPWAHLGPTNFLLQKEVMTHVYSELFKHDQYSSLSNSYGLFRRMTGVGSHDRSAKKVPKVSGLLGMVTAGDDSNSTKMNSTSVELSVAPAKNPPTEEAFSLQSGYAGLSYTPVPKVPVLIFEAQLKSTGRKTKTSADITTSREKWHEIPFRYAPTFLNKMPVRTAPYQPRFDWQLWFAALADQYAGQSWLVRMLWLLITEKVQPAAGTTGVAGSGEEGSETSAPPLYSPTTDVRELLELDTSTDVDWRTAEIKAVRVQRYFYDFSRYENPPWHPKQQGSGKTGKGPRVKNNSDGGELKSSINPTSQWWTREYAGKWLDTVDATTLAPLAKSQKWKLAEDADTKRKKKKPLQGLENFLSTVREFLVQKPKQMLKGFVLKGGGKEGKQGAGADSEDGSLSNIVDSARAVLAKVDENFLFLTVPPVLLAILVG